MVDHEKRAARARVKAAKAETKSARRRRRAVQADDRADQSVDVAAAAGTLPVYLRVGDTEEAHLGDLDLDVVPTDDPTKVRVHIDVRTALPAFLRAVADEIENPTEDDDSEG
ncbi:hypothetical protein [Actinomycetospora aeridis]|uniref:Lsr2 protein n=1 Tax=Actinomycetospora aeridis TaxID=3129231 RepID=A0ABU8N1R2_9PSEU